MGVVTNKELRRLAQIAEAQGWTITHTRKTHLAWRNPQGQLVITASTPSDRRAIQNARSFLRRYGLVLDE